MPAWDDNVQAISKQYKLNMHCILDIANDV